ncbi:MAG: tetratricopeptide repeat protein [Chitinophagales bacterium]
MMKKTFLYLFLVLFVSNTAFGQKKNKTKKKAKSSVSKKTVSEQDKIKAERIFFSGQKEKVKENYFEALKYFEQAVKIYPQIDAAWFEIAQINLMQKDYKSSLANIEKALKVSPTNKWYREYYAQLLSANTEFEKATTVFNALRKDYPNKLDYYYDEAFFLLKLNKDKEAIKVYNELEEKIGIQKEISLQKYKIYLKQSNVEDAEKELIKLSDAYPDNLEYLNKLAQFQLLNNEKEKAEKTLQKILKTDPENTAALLTLADYYRAKGDNENYKKYSKLAFSNPNISIDTKIAVLYNSISQFQNKTTDNLNDAFEYVELLVEAHPEEAKTWAIYGDLYNLSEKPKLALEKYEKSLEIQQDIFTVWQQVFFIQSDLKLYESLVENTNNAKELFPNQALVYFFNGLANQELKEAEKAVKAYEKGVKMAANQPALQSQFYSNLGGLHNELKNYEKSDKNYDKSLLLEPNNQYTLNNYAYYLSLRAENLEKAKEMSLKSLALSEDNPTYLDTYAWILFQNKEYKEALKIQEKAIKLIEKPSADMLEHYGDMLYKLNRIAEAKTYWQKAKDAGQSGTALDEKIESGKL